MKWYGPAGLVAGTLLPAAFALSTIAAAVVKAQAAGTTAPKDAKRKSVASKTSWGHPDLQGIWSNATTTPLERPDGVTKAVLSGEERATLEAEVARQRNTDTAPRQGDPGTYNEFWWERGGPLSQTSLIVDPPDGHMPALTPEGARRVAAHAEALKGRGEFDSWIDRPLQERCLLYHGVPPIPTGYNNNYQIVQTPDYVVIRHEMLAENRIIPLDGRPHLSANIRTWMGDPRGRWEGQTLVVENTNFNGWGGGLYDAYLLLSRKLQGTGSTLKIVERFTRLDENTIDYRATMEDPTMFTRPWTISLPLMKVRGPIYEYACHEGNYAMEHMLKGGRMQEQRPPN